MASCVFMEGPESRCDKCGSCGRYPYPDQGNPEPTHFCECGEPQWDSLGCGACDDANDQPDPEPVLVGDYPW